MFIYVRINSFLRLIINSNFISVFFICLFLYSKLSLVSFFILFFFFICVFRFRFRVWFFFLFYLVYFSCHFFVFTFIWSLRLIFIITFLWLNFFVRRLTHLFLISTFLTTLLFTTTCCCFCLFVFWILRSLTAFWLVFMFTHDSILYNIKLIFTHKKLNLL